MLVIVSACRFDCYPNRGFSEDLVSQTLPVHSSGFIDSYNFRWVVQFFDFQNVCTLLKASMKVDQNGDGHMSFEEWDTEIWVPGVKILQVKVAPCMVRTWLYFDFCGALTLFCNCVLSRSFAGWSKDANDEKSWYPAHTWSLSICGNQWFQDSFPPKKQLRFMALMADRKEAPKAPGVVIPSSFLGAMTDLFEERVA